MPTRSCYEALGGARGVEVHEVRRFRPGHVGAFRSLLWHVMAYAQCWSDRSKQGPKGPHEQKQPTNYIVSTIPLFQALGPEREIRVFAAFFGPY